MSFQSDIKRFLFILFWVLIGGGMLTLLLAAIHKKNKSDCKGYSIEIRGAKNIIFLDKSDIEKEMLTQMKGSPVGMPVSSIHLEELQQIWEKSDWVRQAELYFDSKDELHIIIHEKEPVARVFTQENNSFYLDSAANKLSLSDKFSARLPVFTGFPDKKTYSARDSALLKDIRTLARYVSNHPFWLAQATQFDITAQHRFEMIPLIGNHIVRIGDAEDLDKKFNRLLAFYQQVLGKTGFNKYRIIDVQFDGQVVASKYLDNPSVDSIQLKNNIEKLLQESKLNQQDLPVMNKDKIITATADTLSSNENDKETERPVLEPVPENKLPVNKPVVKPDEKPAKKKLTENKNKRIPKALMPAKISEDPNGGYN
jgi:cell division protein FtsQ